MQTIYVNSKDRESIKQWWTCEPNSLKAAESLHALYEVLIDLNQWRYEANLRHMRLYNNQNLQGLNLKNYMQPLNSTPSGIPTLINDRLTLNVIKSVIDTNVSKIAKSKVKVSFLTTGGTWKQQRKAMTLNKFMTGVFYKTGIYAKAPMCFRDAGISGDGFMKIYTDPATKEIKAERKFFNELLVDPNDAYYGDPALIYEYKYVSKEVLKRMFPDAAKEIDECEIAESYQTSGSVDCVRVVEGWLKASREGKKDGRHIIAIKNKNLLDEPYRRTKFPFAHLKYTDPVFGFHGQGIAEEITGIQVEINRILRHIQQVMRLVCIPRVLVEAGAQVDDNQITNQIGGIIRYAGTKPEFIKVDGVAPEYFQQLLYLDNKAYEITGVSQMSATGQNILGANASGRALRTMTNIESERFVNVGRAYEQFHIDIADLVLDEIKYSNSNMEVKSFNRREGVEIISSADLDIYEDDYVMQCFPVSALPDEPGARLQTVIEMQNSGNIDPETGNELMDFPDLDAKTSLINAPIRLITKSIEKMLDTGKYIPPEPYFNLQKCLQQGVLFYNRVCLMDEDEESKELLRTYIEGVKSLIDTAAQEGQQLPGQESVAAPGQELLESQLAADPAAQAAPMAALPMAM